MKKYVSIILRTSVAVLGLAYIVWMVDLRDRVEVPAGTTLPDGRQLEESTSFKVIQGSYDPSDPAGELTVQIGLEAGKPKTMPVPQAALGTDEHGLRLVPGLITMVRTADRLLLLLGLVTVSLIYPILMYRWWWLMHARGMSVPMWKAFRLTMVGNFFNFCMPGTTGGDVIKAYYAAKGSGRRADAVVSVIVDRVCGLFGLLVLAGLVGLFMLRDDTARHVTVTVWLICAGFLVGSAVYFSNRLRAKLGIDWLISKLPGKQLLASIDQAAYAYRDHKTVVIGSIVMSVTLHVALVTATAMAGYAMGIQTPISLLMIVIPVSFLVGAIPIAPQGLGVMEFFAVTMLQSSGAYPNQVVGMLIMIRLYQMFYSLLGSVFLLKGDIHLHPQQQEPSDASLDAAPPAPAR